MAGFTNCRARAGIGGAISEFIVVHSQNPKALCLDQTADQILASMSSLYCGDKSTPVRLIWQ